MQCLQGLLDACFFVLSQFYVLFEVFQRFDAILDLPLPIVPLSVGNFRKQLFSSAFHFTLVYVRRI